MSQQPRNGKWPSTLTKSRIDRDEAIGRRARVVPRVLVALGKQLRPRLGHLGPEALHQTRATASIVVALQEQDVDQVEFASRDESLQNFELSALGVQLEKDEILLPEILDHPSHHVDHGNRHVDPPGPGRAV